MTATTNIGKAETITNPTTTFHGNGNTGPSTGKAESELRAAARRHGLTMKELARLMGVNAGYLSDVANGRRPWTPMMRERVMAVLGEVPGQGIVYRQGGVITGESSFIRERTREKGMNLKDLAVIVEVSYGYMTQAARGHRNMSPSVQVRVEKALDAPVRVESALLANRLGSIANGGSTFIRERARQLGMSMGELADLVGVSRGYMSDVARGRRNLSPHMQARVEAVLDAPVRVEAAQTPVVDPRALWDRMEAHGFSQNETARRAGISSALLSQIMNGKRTPSGDVLREAARGAVPAVGGGSGGSRRGQGAGLEEGRAQRRGGARRGRAWRWWPEPRRRDRAHRRAGALGRGGAVRLPGRLRQPGPGLGHPSGGREGLLRHAEPAGARRRVGTRQREGQVGAGP